ALLPRSIERGGFVKTGWRDFAAVLLLLLPLLGQAAIAEEQKPAGASVPAADGTPPAVTVPIHYLTKAYDEPPPDVVAKAKEIMSKGDALIVADLEAKDLLAVADLPEAKSSVIFNIRLSDDGLRGEQCRSNIFHIAPSNAMRADALAQYLIWKKWPKWFVLKGVAPSDQDYDAAVERAAGRFGGKIVEERKYKFDAANPRTDSGHQQIQTQMPEVTQGAPEHDVVWVVDTTERFGEYVSYRDYDPRPVVGTQGLIAVAWHRSYEQYAGTQMQHRFDRFAKRVMTERDYSAWIAVRAVGEAVTRSGKSDVPDIRKYLLSDDFTVAAFKGEGLSFRRWDRQLRQRC
ncbi:MAG: ABC transporter substrate-binding protein, partial [Methyloceanibacter sp.]